jgi:hypothetical protein
LQTNNYDEKPWANPTTRKTTKNHHSTHIPTNTGEECRRVHGILPGMSGVRLDPNGSTADHRAIKARKADVFFNVFFVGNIIDVTKKGDTILANTSKPPDQKKPLRCCLCRDPGKGDLAGIDWGEILAHEAGHALGEDDDYHDKDSLMYWAADNTDNLIYPSMAQRMWKSFGTYPQVQ